VVGRVKARRRPLKAQRWAAWGGRTRCDSMAAQSGSTGAGWERELTGRAHALARGEREVIEDRRHDPKKKTYSAEYAKGALRPSGPTKGMAACGRGGLVR
jgi:hypothetical protein